MAFNRLSEILVKNGFTLDQLSTTSKVDDVVLKQIIEHKENVPSGTHEKIIEGLNKLLKAFDLAEHTAKEVFPRRKPNQRNFLKKIIDRESISKADLERKSAEIKRRVSGKTISRLTKGEPGVKETSKRSILEALNAKLRERPDSRQYNYGDLFPGAHEEE